MNLRERIEGLTRYDDFYDGIREHDCGEYLRRADVLALVEEGKADLDLSTSMTALCYHLAEAQHYGQHHAWNKLDFDGCRHGFCGHWHNLQEKAWNHLTPKGEAE
jgi:hypothetical protein